MNKQDYIKYHSSASVEYIMDETLIKRQNALFKSKGYVSRKGILLSVVKDEIQKRFPDSNVIQNGQWSNYTEVENRQLLLINNILIWA